MSTCVPTPVSTAFSTVTQNIVTTTYSLSTSAAPPVITTHLDSYCENEAVVLDSSVCLQTGTRTGTETLQPASDVVYTITYETTIPVTSHIPINTIYGGCSDTPSNPGVIGGSNPQPSGGSNSGSNISGSNLNAGNNSSPGSSGSNGGSISVPSGLSLITSSVLVYTTGPPTISLVPSVMTLPDGEVTTTSILTLVTPKPSQVFVPTTTLVEATGMSNSGPDNCGNVGMIVGAVIGGFIGLCLMILAWWYVRRRRKIYDEILHEREKQINDQEARREAIERSKDPTRIRETDPKPTPYHYGSLLTISSKSQLSTSTGVTLSQNPYEGSGVGTRTAYMAPSSPLFSATPVMGEFGANPGFEGHDGSRDPMNLSISSMSTTTSGSIHTMGSAPTLASDSGRSGDMEYLHPGSSERFVEVDIGGSRGISPPPHLSMSFGSWNTSTSQGPGSVGFRRSSGVDPGTDPGLGTTYEDQEGEEELEGQRVLLHPGQHYEQQWQQKQQRDTMESRTTATLVQMEAVRDDEGRRGSHLRKRSGSPVSWAPRARGTLFIVNQRVSEDL